ncbi:MAG: hypothetical protein IJF13_00965 [Clostridia bacterium]|nr:hypothetical protein [Clostridia bacterium]
MVKNGAIPGERRYGIKKSTVRCSIKNLGSSSVLVYRLVRCDDTVYDGYDGNVLREYYSISVIRIGDDGTRDEKLLRDVSRSYSEAVSFYEKFVRGTVTPVTAEEIMDDLLGA